MSLEIIIVQLEELSILDMTFPPFDDWKVEKRNSGDTEILFLDLSAD